MMKILSHQYGLPFGLNKDLSYQLMRRKAEIAGYFLRTTAALVISGGLNCSGAPCAVNYDRNSQRNTQPDYLITTGEVGECGGALTISERAEPKTLNPLIAMDGNSREIISLLMADLIHINRSTQESEAGLARSWTASADGQRYTLQLRRGLRFSDGYPFDADDVLFTFRAYLDERVHASQRDFLIVGGKPISVQKVDAYTVVFQLARPYAAAERLFDSIAILPKHLLETAYEHGTLRSVWGLTTAPNQIAGLGPFRLKEWIPGQRLVLQRNPFYWKRDRNGNQLPYLNEIISLSGISSEAEVMRFEAGETQIISRVSPEDFEVLKRAERARRFRIFDAGPGLEYTFLVCNLNKLDPGQSTSLVEKQEWFRQVAFRQALSNAIDRDSIVRLAYAGRAYPLSVPVSPGNRFWFNPQIPKPSRSVERAKQLLREAHFSWNADGSLIDPSGVPVEFSIMHNAGRAQHVQMATLIQQDLKDIGVKVILVPLDFAALVDRVFQSFAYDTAIMTLADGDADPNSEMSVWPSHGATHIWELRSNDSPDDWQQEVDRLMNQQMITLDRSERKKIFDRVQRLLWQNQPVVFLVSPYILAGAGEQVANFHPAVLSSYTLWNADQLFLRSAKDADARRQTATGLDRPSGGAPSAQSVWGVVRDHGVAATVLRGFLNSEQDSAAH